MKKNNQKKVIMFIPCLIERGPIIVVRDIIENYQGKEYKFIILTLRKNKKENFKLKKEYEIYEIDNKKVPLKVNQLRKIVKEINPDIIHCHGYWPTIFSGIFFRKYKIVSTLHNNPLQDFELRYGKIISKFMIKSMIFYQNKFQKNISISKYVEETHKKLGVLNLETIYNGIPNDIKINNLNRINKHQKNKVNLITVCNLNKIKNIEFLIKVIEKLKNIINVEYTIVGDGPDKSKICNMIIEKRMTNIIKLVGRKSREEVYRYLEDKDIFLFASLSEGFGLVIVEALKKGVPVITSNIPVMKELIISGKNGVICDLNINEYIEAILEVNKNLNEYKKNTQIYFNKDFFVENMSKNYMDLYRKLSL